MQENFRIKGKKLYFGFVDLEKAFDRVPREVIRWAMHKLGVEEWLVWFYLLSGERQKPVQKAARWPCGLCGRGVGSNSIQCTSCHKWVHKKCSGIKGSMYKVMRSFICRGCSNPVISAGHTNLDIGASANLEVVDKFCYLGDILSEDGDADAAVETRIRIGWNKFRQMVPIITNRDISLIMRGRLYSSCV